MEGERSSDNRDGLIVGGGISGLAFAHWLGLGKNAGSWELWESAPRLGGTIGTDRVDGYSVDWGPNGFLDREPLTLRLVDEIGLSRLTERANENSEKRFIVKQGRLHPVPFSPPLFLSTGLLGPLEKLRVFAEPLIRKRSDQSDESVFDFAARRMGRGAAETFVDPMVSGIFGGDARKLSLPSCFPIMREMEMEHGSLVRAMLARKRARAIQAQNRSKGKRTGGPAGPGGTLTSFQGGLDLLVTRLGKYLQGVIQLDRAVSRVARDGQTWEVTDTRGDRMRTNRVVLACPTFAASRILRDFDPELADAFAAIPYAPIAVVASGHRVEDIRHSLDGFGFLIPRRERTRTLGSIWTSSIFSGRCPTGSVQFRTMLGGANDPDAAGLSDGELWATVRKELDPLIGIKKDPDKLRIYRWPQGIPQFNLGHRERRERIERLAGRHPGLHCVGNAYYGVGLNDCVKMAHRVAQEIGWKPSVPRRETNLKVDR